MIVYTENSKRLHQKTIKSNKVSGYKNQHTETNCIFMHYKLFEE